MKLVDILQGGVGAVVVVTLFIALAISNGIVNVGIGVLVTNPEVAGSHPVYVLPKGYAFSIWGIIYLLEGVFSFYQVLPSMWEDKTFMAIRPLVILSSLTNITWLFLFGNVVNWVALIVIVAYEITLFVILQRFDVNLFDRSSPQSVMMKLVSSGFSVNAAWVFVASLLQLNINIMAEGIIPSPDFAVGSLMLAVFAACYFVFARADVFYAFGSAWALGGIIANQAEGTTWGTAADICTKACFDNFHVCQGPTTAGFVTPAMGPFYKVCSNFNATSDENFSLVETSNAVVTTCYVGIVFVVVALFLGIVNTYLPPKPKQEYDPDSTANVLLDM